MKNQTQDQFKGFTLVWEGRPTDFIPVIKQWAALSQDSLQVAIPANPSNVTLWVANEHIDWKYYRFSDEFRPKDSNNLRQSGSSEDWSPEVQKAIKEGADYIVSRQRHKEKTEQTPNSFMQDYRRAFADE